MHTLLFVLMIHMKLATFIKCIHSSTLDACTHISRYRGPLVYRYKSGGVADRLCVFPADES